jgi:hypothetical protein
MKRDELQGIDFHGWLDYRFLDIMLAGKYFVD